MTPSEIHTFVPLIIDGIDIKLANNAFTFEPESFGTPTHAKAEVSAQGADIASCHAAVDSCAQSFEAWRRTSVTHRRDLLLRLAKLLKTKGDEVCAIMEDEIHATALWSSINLKESITMVEETAALLTSSCLDGSLPNIQDPESQALVLVEPLGVVLGIAPWNSPLILGFRAVLPAIAVGNTAILKGSELSPRVHYFIASLFREAGFPPGVCNFLLHRSEHAASVFEAIIDRKEVRKCNFTGSTPVGRLIASRAAVALKPCLLELGGKNFAVVLDDADVERAARMIYEGAFLNSGQICMSTDTALVAAPIFSKFKEALLQITIDASQESRIQPLITTKAIARVRALVADATSKGATIHTVSSISLISSSRSQEKSVPGWDHTVSATIVERVDKSMRIFTEETFGPVLSMIEIASAEEAVKTINSCQYGLSSAIHTRDHYKALCLAKKMNVSAIHINGTTVHDEAVLPHGGHGDSGWGRFGGRWGLSEFVQTKTVIMNK